MHRRWNRRYTKDARKERYHGSHGTTRRADELRVLFRRDCRHLATGRRPAIASTLQSDRAKSGAPADRGWSGTERSGIMHITDPGETTQAHGNVCNCEIDIYLCIAHVIVLQNTAAAEHYISCRASAHHTKGSAEYRSSPCWHHEASRAMHGRNAYELMLGWATRKKSQLVGKLPVVSASSCNLQQLAAPTSWPPFSH